MTYVFLCFCHFPIWCRGSCGIWLYWFVSIPDLYLLVTPIVGVCNCSMFCCTLLYVHFSIAIILMGKRELIALLNLSSWCLVMVERLFLTVPRGCLQFVIVVFPDHTHLLFLTLIIKCYISRVRLAPWNWFKPSGKIFYWPFQGRTSFVDLLWVLFCLVFAMPLPMSVFMYLVVTRWERADLLALVYGV